MRKLPGGVGVKYPIGTEVKILPGVHPQCTDNCVGRVTGGSAEDLEVFVLGSHWLISAKLVVSLAEERFYGELGFKQRRTR